ncbi:MAG TPA: Rnf-Nqr domain containing protein, partial [Bacteroidales bacterium]|nr:Rnf-Nqr domain containing protein [Bacteroidales bacterium]
MTYILIIISAVFVNNIVLSQFLGICPFIGVSNKVKTAIGMSAAVLFVMVLATMVTYMLFFYILKPLPLQFLNTITFIVIIASLVQMVEIIIKKVSYSLYEALGVFLPLITTNCAVLGVAMLALDLPVKYSFVHENTLMYAVVFA